MSRWVLRLEIRSSLNHGFRSFVAEAKQMYDLVMIDCHPAGSILTRTSLRNSNHVLIPVAPQAYAARGVALMMQFIKATSDAGHGNVSPHILFNMTSRSGPISTAEKEIKGHSEFGAHCMTNTLHRYKAFSEPVEGVGFVWSSSKPYSTEAYCSPFSCGPRAVWANRLVRVS